MSTDQPGSAALCECCEKPKPDIALVHDEDDPTFVVELCRDCREVLGRGVVCPT